MIIKKITWFRRLAKIVSKRKYKYAEDITFEDIINTLEEIIKVLSKEDKIKFDELISNNRKEK